jgi:hypothetical protein
MVWASVGATVTLPVGYRGQRKPKLSTQLQDKR